MPPCINLLNYEFIYTKCYLSDIMIGVIYYNFPTYNEKIRHPLWNMTRNWCYTWQAVISKYTTEQNIRSILFHALNT